MRTRTSRAAAACALLATTALASPALAQSTTNTPAYRNLDANGVDLTRGDFVMSLVEGSIGSGQGELTLVRDGVWLSGYNGHRWDSVTLNQWSGKQSVSFGSTAEYFTGTTSQQGNGSTLSLTADGYVHQAADGTKTIFTPRDANCSPTATQSCTWLPSSISSPDGTTVSFAWEQWLSCPDVPIGDEVYCTVSATRLGQVSNDHGYSIAFQYAVQDGGGSGGPPLDWSRRTKAKFYNSEAGVAAQGTISYAHPAVGVTEVTDMAGRVWRIAGSFNTITGVRRPGAASDTTTVSRSSGVVTSVTRDGVTTTYNRSVSGNVATTTVTNALGQQTVVTSDLTVGRPTSIKDGLNRTTSYQYDGFGRLTRTTAPEGNYVHTTYDTRGNVTQSRAVAKPGSGLADIVTSATYEAGCANPVTCNQPLSTTDAGGHVTDYTYDSTHGGVLTVTAPAAPNGVRPQARYTYALVNGEHRPTGTSTCQTQSSCTGTADEVKTTLTYDANGNVTGTSTGAGDGSLTATQAMTYDGMGNLLTVDGPLPGNADTVRMRYNAARELVGTVSPDPDGAGPLKPRAVRNTIDARGLPTKVEQGNVIDQSDGAWSAFSPAQAVETGYDANARPVTQKLVAGGTTYALAQTSYDALGRVECQATRMNSGAFGSLPASACALGTQGSHGPDRIAKAVYNAAGEVTQSRVAVGTANEAAEASATYRFNGQLETLTDGENNRTTYAYDGHDRLKRTSFPVPTKGANASSGTDYEELGYDPRSLVTSRRLRDGQVIGYGYDALGRATSKDLPGSEPDASYVYDALGRMTQASQAGRTFGFIYDALGRQLTEVTPKGTIRREFDLAGRKTRLVHPDGYSITYDQFVTGEIRSIRETGAVSGPGVLATYGYDDLGRRTSLTRGNGTVSNYAYDPASRLSQLAHDFAGTAHDVTFGFGHNAAGQIATRSLSNDLYAHAPGSGETNETANGLNQVVQSGAATLAFDARGNMTSDGANTFAYSSENLLLSQTVPSPTQLIRNSSFGYDPLMRWYESTGGSCTGCAYLYEDGNLIAEIDGSEVYRRNVYDAGGERIVTMSLGRDNVFRKYWIHGDERGSSLAASPENGTNDSYISTYDEYGNQGGAASGFGLAGERYMGFSNLLYLRARVYNPALGRFMQADPIGYGDGPNMYAYVGGDPVNWTDPSGLCRDASGEYYQPPTGTRICDAAPSDRSSGSGGSGGNGAGGSGSGGGGGLVGGPYDGLTYCPGCIGGSDPGRGRSEARWGGYYDRGYWISTSASFGSGSGLLNFASLDRRYNPLDPHSASSEWFERLEAAGAEGLLESNLEMAVAGTLQGRTAAYGNQLGLPGGRRTLYYRYEAIGFQGRVEGLHNGARIAYAYGSNTIYFAPFHGKATIDVPTGWIAFQVKLDY